jgi:hypothetical protein
LETKTIFLVFIPCRVPLGTGTESIPCGMPCLHHSSQFYININCLKVQALKNITFDKQYISAHVKDKYCGKECLFSTSGAVGVAGKASMAAVLNPETMDPQGIHVASSRGCEKYFTQSQNTCKH